MIDAYKKFWKQLSDFRGVASRKDFWYVVIMHKLVFFVLFIPVSIFRPGSIIFILWFFALVLFSLVILFGYVSLLVRRLRDAGFHWAFMFIGFIPYIGSLVILVLVCMPTKQQPTVVDELDF